MVSFKSAHIRRRGGRMDLDRAGVLIAHARGSAGQGGAGFWPRMARGMMAARGIGIKVLGSPIALVLSRSRDECAPRRATCRRSRPTWSHGLRISSTSSRNARISLPLVCGWFL